MAKHQTGKKYGYEYSMCTLRKQTCQLYVNQGLKSQASKQNELIQTVNGLPKFNRRSAAKSMVKLSFCCNNTTLGHYHRVILVEVLTDQLLAQVAGKQLYQVRFWRRGNQWQFACTCPYASEGAFCKHCVAVSLVTLSNVTPQEENSAKNK